MSINSTNGLPYTMPAGFLSGTPEVSENADRNNISALPSPETRPVEPGLLKQSDGDVFQIKSVFKDTIRVDNLEIKGLRLNNKFIEIKDDGQREATYQVLKDLAGKQISAVTWELENMKIRVVAKSKDTDFTLFENPIYENGEFLSQKSAVSLLRALQINAPDQTRSTEIFSLEDIHLRLKDQLTDADLAPKDRELVKEWLICAEPDKDRVRSKIGDSMARGYIDAIASFSGKEDQYQIFSKYNKMADIYKTLGIGIGTNTDREILHRISDYTSDFLSKEDAELLTEYEMLCQENSGSVASGRIEERKNKYESNFNEAIWGSPKKKDIYLRKTAFEIALRSQTMPVTPEPESQDPGSPSTIPDNDLFADTLLNYRAAIATDRLSDNEHFGKELMKAFPNVLSAFYTAAISGDHTMTVDIGHKVAAAENLILSGGLMTHDELMKAEKIALDKATSSLIPAPENGTKVINPEKLPSNVLDFVDNAKTEHLEDTHKALVENVLMVMLVPDIKMEDKFSSSESNGQYLGGGIVVMNMKDRDLTKESDAVVFASTLLHETTHAVLANGAKRTTPGKVYSSAANEGMAFQTGGEAVKSLIDSGKISPDRTLVQKFAGDIDMSEAALKITGSFEPVLPDAANNISIYPSASPYFASIGLTRALSNNVINSIELPFPDNTDELLNFCGNSENTYSCEFSGNNITLSWSGRMTHDDVQNISACYADHEIIKILNDGAGKFDKDWGSITGVFTGDKIEDLPQHLKGSIKKALDKINPDWKNLDFSDSLREFKKTAATIFPEGSNFYESDYLILITNLHPFFAAREMEVYDEKGERSSTLNAGLQISVDLKPLKKSGDIYCVSVTCDSDGKHYLVDVRDLGLDAEQYLSNDPIDESLLSRKSPKE